MFLTYTVLKDVIQGVMYNTEIIPASIHTAHSFLPPHDNLSEVEVTISERLTGAINHASDVEQCAA